MISIPQKVSGYFKLEVCKLDHSVARSVEFANLITDAGLARMGADADYLSVCRVGGGNAVPSSSDTTLHAQIASANVTSSINFANSVPPYYASKVVTAQFAVGAATGIITEVGMGWAGGLFSRALVMGDAGAPAPVTVLPDEYLIVVYEHRVYAPESDFIGTLSLKGTLAGVHDVTGRASEAGTATRWIAGLAQNNGARLSVTAYDGTIRSATQEPVGSRTTMAGSNGVADNNSAVFALAAGTADFNLPNGIRSIKLAMGGGVYQFQFDPPIMKTEDHTLQLQFRHSWGRR